MMKRIVASFCVALAFAWGGTAWAATCANSKLGFKVDLDASWSKPVQKGCLISTPKMEAVAPFVRV